MGTGEFRSYGNNLTVGTVGVLCGERTLERVVRKTPAGPLHPATCNRWHGHSGFHRETRTCDFAVLHEWHQDACRAPDWKEQRRREMAAAAREGKR